MATRKVDKDGYSYWTKHPNSKKDFTVDWSEWLAEVSEVITSASCIVAPSGLDLTTQSNTSTTHSMFFSGGADGTEYIVTSRIFTATRRENAVFKVKVDDQPEKRN